MSDNRARYRAVQDEIFAAYGRGDYATGIATARAAMAELPSWRADLAHAAACLLAVAGRPAEALAELRSAYRDGAWWHRRILLDDDLTGLRDLPGFAELADGAQARAAAELAGPGPDPLVRRPRGAARGVLVALHGAGETATDAAEQWRAAVEAGYVLLALDSSQRNTPTYRTWPDPALGLRDIAAALAHLSAEERRLPMVAAGFSAGGRQAMLWALAGEPGTPDRFVAVAPAIHPAQLTGVSLAAARGLAGAVLVGERDDDVAEGALAAVRDLRAAGLPCRLDLVPDLGHDFPDDFAGRLAGLLDEPAPTPAAELAAAVPVPGVPAARLPAPQEADPEQQGDHGRAEREGHRR